MQKKTKSRLFSIFFVSTCLVGSALSLAYFFNDLNKVSFKEEKQIASIQFKKKIAQRRFSDSVVWERLVTNSPLYNEDLISTETDAFATILFENKTSLSIDQHTMIQIFESASGELSLSVTSGSIDIDTSEAISSVSVDFDGAYKLNLEKGTKMSASKKDSGTDLLIHQGSVVAQNNDGTTSVLSQGQSINIDNNGKSKKNELGIKNFSYNKKVFCIDGESQIIDFDFLVEQDMQDKQIVLQTSYTSDFSTIVSEQTITNKAQINANDFNKDFYYRAYFVNQSGNTVQGKIDLVKINQTEQDTQTEVPIFYSEKDKSNVVISWNEFENSDYVTVEVYKTNANNEYSETDLVYKTKQVRNSLSLNNLGQGSYAYKVIPHYVNMDADLNTKVNNSLVKKYFNVQAKNKESPNTKVEIQSTNKPILEEEKEKTQEVLESVVKEKIETKQKTTDKETKKTKQSQKKTTKKVKPQQPKQPKEPVLPKEPKLPEQSKPKQEQKIEEKPQLVPLAKPVLLEPKDNFKIDSDYLSKNRKINFVWQKVQNATEYKFSISIKNKNGSLKELYTKTVNTNSLEFTELTKLDIGKFQWQVKAIAKDEKGDIILESVVSSSNFEIDFSLPTQVKTLDQGTMYGN